MGLKTEIKCWHSDTCQPGYYAACTQHYVSVEVEKNTTYSDLMWNINQQAQNYLPPDFSSAAILSAIQDMFSEVVDMFEVFDESVEDGTHVYIGFEAK
jgi:hypothetical protein